VFPSCVSRAHRRVRVGGISRGLEALIARMPHKRFFTCPQCGESVREDARSCPHCGSDDETGWHPYAEEDSIELPGDNEDDTPCGATRPGATSAFVILLLLVALLGVIALYGFRGLFSPYAMFGALILVAVVVHHMRRRR
jgi:hypothetical protein